MPYQLRGSLALGKQDKIVVNGKDVGEVVPGTFFYVDVPPGEVKIFDRFSEKTKNKKSLFSENWIYQKFREYWEKVIVRTLNVKKNEVKYLQIAFEYHFSKELGKQALGYVQYRIMNGRQGREEISTLKFRPYP